MHMKTGHKTLRQAVYEDAADLAHMIGHGVLFVFGVPIAFLIGAYLGYLILGPIPLG